MSRSNRFAIDMPVDLLIGTYLEQCSDVLDIRVSGLFLPRRGRKTDVCAQLSRSSRWGKQWELIHPPWEPVNESN
jgi:hypothetical protein